MMQTYDLSGDTPDAKLGVVHKSFRNYSRGLWGRLAPELRDHGVGRDVEVIHCMYAPFDAAVVREERVVEGRLGRRGFLLLHEARLSEV